MAQYNWDLIDSWRYDRNLSYNEIRKLCIKHFDKAPSKGTLAYHYGDGQRSKTRNRSLKFKSTDQGKFAVKVSRFKNRQRDSTFSPELKMSEFDRFRNKIKNFKRKGNRDRAMVEKNYTTEDVIEMLWPEGTSACGNQFPLIECYLTGDVVDVTHTDTHLDHIDSKKGNEIENIGVTQKYANIMKSDMTVEELKEMCKKILKHLG